MATPLGGTPAGSPPQPPAFLPPPGPPPPPPPVVLDPATLATISATVAAALAAALPQLPAPVVNVAARPPKNDVALPRAYGGGEDFREFMQEIHLYLDAHLTHYPTDHDKVSFIISLLQYGRAETWKVQYQADHTDPAGTITWPTLAAFTADLVNTFEDPNLAEKSYRKFEELRQGTMTADEFFSHFDILRSRAGLTGPAVDVVLVNQLRRALNGRVIMGVMRSSPVPTTYAAWRAKAIEIDRTEQQLDHTLRGRRRALPTPPVQAKDAQARPAFRLPLAQPAQQRPQAHLWTPPVQRPAGPAPQVPHVPQGPRAPNQQGAFNGNLYWDFQGVAPGTHPGMGIPMDMSINNARRNWACYKCGQVGHFIKDCPRGRDAIRAIISALDPTDRLAFAEEFRTMNESDFQEDTAGNEAEEVEVRAMPDELEEILENSDFLAPQ